MSKKFIAFYEGLVLSRIDLGIQTTSLVLNKLSVCELRGHVLFLPTKVASSLMLRLLSFTILYHNIYRYVLLPPFGGIFTMFEQQWCPENKPLDITGI